MYTKSIKAQECFDFIIKIFSISYICNLEAKSHNFKDVLGLSEVWLNIKTRYLTISKRRNIVLHQRRL